METEQNQGGLSKFIQETPPHPWQERRGLSSCCDESSRDTLIWAPSIAKERGQEGTVLSISNASIPGLLLCCISEM